MVDSHSQMTAEDSLFHIFHSGKYVYCFLLCFCLIVSFSVSVATAADYPYATSFSDDNLPGNLQNTPSTPNLDIWCFGVGEGFRAGTRDFSVSAGTSYGILVFGGIEHHQLSMISVSYGEMTGDMKGTDKWYRGNIELRAELFGGAQFNSERLSLAGVTPHIRYIFATGTRLIPFIDAGGGVLLTEIRGPDLGGAFEFNEQAIIGADYFLKDNWSINIAIQYLHISDAGIAMPNNGVNTVGAFLGAQWFF
jgi:opacity protein-like surface antigen